MNTSTRTLLASIALAALLPTLASAAGLGFLRRSPVSYFTDADFKLMSDAARQVLDGSEPTATRQWSNPKTGYSGRIQGLGLFKSSDGLDCQKLKIWTQAKGIENESVLPVCKDSQGEWKLAAGKELVKRD